MRRGSRSSVFGDVCDREVNVVSADVAYVGPFELQRLKKRSDRPTCELFVLGVKTRWKRNFRANLVLVTAIEQKPRSGWRLSGGQTSRRPTRYACQIQRELNGRASCRASSPGGFRHDEGVRVRDKSVASHEGQCIRAVGRGRRRSVLPVLACPVALMQQLAHCVDGGYPASDSVPERWPGHREACSPRQRLPLSGLRGPRRGGDPCALDSHSRLSPAGRMKVRRHMPQSQTFEHSILTNPMPQILVQNRKLWSITVAKTPHRDRVDQCGASARSKGLEPPTF